MRYQTESLESYIYDLDEHKMLSDSYCLIGGIGSEHRVSSSNYSWDCMDAPRNECTFQYTVSGEGAVVINKKTYTLHAGQAFLVEKPGQFRYYMPRSASHWSFKWISMNVPSIFYWKDITDHYGRIVNLGDDSSAMRYWETIYQHAQRSELNNVFLSSAYAYTFIMCLHQDLQNSHITPQAVDLFQYCLQSIHQRFKDPTLSLNTIAEELNSSPSYLSRMFKSHMQESYIQYLTRHRMNIAEEMLTSSSQTIESIAAKVGLQDANYFSRVFRKHYGISPTDYRKQHKNNAHNTLVRAESVFSSSDPNRK